MKNNPDKPLQKPYEEPIDKISRCYINGRAQTIRAVNERIISTNWDIGKYIVEYEQGGKRQAKYGTGLLENIFKDLTLRYGRGFSRSNLNYMRLFYLRFPNCETLSHNLSWSHYCEPVKIENEPERSFYYQQNILKNWSIRELKRQIEKSDDIVKDVYVFEFLKIPEPYIVFENELETRLIGIVTLQKNNQHQ